MKTFGSKVQIRQSNYSKLQICGYSNSVIITEDTEVRIWFDSSGSMDDTLSPLNTMRDTLLKDALLPFYNNNESLYDEKVTVTSWDSERTWTRLSIEPSDLENGIIHLVFQDEAQPSYHSSTSSFDGSRTSLHESNISTLRDKIENTFPPGKFEAFVFQVQGSAAFKAYLEAVENSTGNYAGQWGLADKNSVRFIYDINDGDSATYYTNLVKQQIL